MALADYMTRKPISEIVSDIEHHGFSKSLGALSITFIGIGAIIGTGIFVLTGQAAAALCRPRDRDFDGARRRCQRARRPVLRGAGLDRADRRARLHLLVRDARRIRGLDHRLGSGARVCARRRDGRGRLVRLPGAACSPISASRSRRIISAAPGTVLVAADGSTVTAIFNLPAALIAILVTVLLVRGVRESATVNGVMVVIKVAVVVLVIAVGVWFVDADRFTPLVPPNTGTFGEFGWSGVMRGAAVIFFAYIGFDAVSTAAQEARHPQRDMPIGILGSLAICSVLYIAVAAVMIGAGAVRAARRRRSDCNGGGRDQPDVVRGVVKIGALAGLSSVILVLSTVKGACSSPSRGMDFCPPLFSKVHPTLHTPWKSKIMIGTIVAIVAALTPIGIFGRNGVDRHAVRLHPGVRRGDVSAQERCRRGSSLPHTRRAIHSRFSALLFCLLLMSGLPFDTWLRLFVWLAIGLAIYFAYGRRNSALRKRMRLA